MPDGCLCSEAAGGISIDEPRAARSAAAVPEKDVASVKMLIEEDVRNSVVELINLSGLNSSALFPILKTDLS